MPTYSYKCSTCGQIEDRVRTCERRNETIVCFYCGGVMERHMPSELSTPWIFKPYWDEHLADDDHPNGVMCTSYRQKRDMMKQMGHEYAN